MPIGKCDHVAWLRVHTDQKLLLQNELRLERLLEDLSYAHEQYPSLVVFLGTRSINVALRELFPSNNIRRLSGSSFMNVRLDYSTTDHENPVFFADSDVGLPQSIPKDYDCHNFRAHPLEWGTSSSETLLYSLHARLSLIFADVVCIFADDFGGLRNVVKVLKTWVSLGSPSTATFKAPVQILIATSNGNGSCTFQVLEEENFRQELMDDDGRLLTDGIFNIKIVRLTNHERVSPLARFNRFKAILRTELDQAMLKRHRHKLNFSAPRFCHFLRRAVDGIVRPYNGPFDFIIESRASRPVSSALSQHLKCFLQLVQGFPYDRISKFIASAFLVDAYPPQMHGNSCFFPVFFVADLSRFRSNRAL